MSTQFESILADAREAKDSEDLNQIKGASEQLNQMMQNINKPLKQQVKQVHKQPVLQSQSMLRVVMTTSLTLLPSDSRMTREGEG